MLKTLIIDCYKIKNRLNRYKFSKFLELLKSLNINIIIKKRRK